MNFPVMGYPALRRISVMLAILALAEACNPEAADGEVCMQTSLLQTSIALATRGKVDLVDTTAAPDAAADAATTAAPDAAADATTAAPVEAAPAPAPAEVQPTDAPTSTTATTSTKPPLPVTTRITTTTPPPAPYSNVAAADPEMLAPLKPLSDADKDDLDKKRAQAQLDCEVTIWSEWSECASDPRSGTSAPLRSHTRTILTPQGHGGAACPPLTEQQTCGDHQAALDAAADAGIAVPDAAADATTAAADAPADAATTAAPDAAAVATTAAPDAASM